MGQQQQEEMIKRSCGRSEPTAARAELVKPTQRAQTAAGGASADESVPGAFIFKGSLLQKGILVGIRVQMLNLD